MLDEWQIRPIRYANVSPDTRGLYRVTGTAHDAYQSHAWSVVLKLVGAPDDPAAADPAAPWYWKREALAYQGGLLADLPGTLTALKCFGVIERSATQCWL